jgi:hypothetical protein
LHGGPVRSKRSLQIVLNDERRGEERMSQKFLVRFRMISIAVFIVGLLSAAVAYSLQLRGAVKLRHARGFTIVTRETTTFSDPTIKRGPEQIDHVIDVRYQKSDGTWKEVRTYRNATGSVVKKDIGFGIPGRGVFQIDRERGVLNFLSPMPPKEKTSYIPISDGHHSPNFLRDGELVQGYATYVLRFPDDDGGGYMDVYYAPELDGTPIRRVTVFKGGVGIAEAIQIKLGDPDDRAFSSLPKWLIDYDRFKEKIQAMEDSGKPEVAEALRRQLEQYLSQQAQDQ